MRKYFNSDFFVHHKIFIAVGVLECGDFFHFSSFWESEESKKKRVTNILANLPFIEKWKCFHSSHHFNQKCIHADKMLSNAWKEITFTLFNKIMIVQSKHRKPRLAFIKRRLKIHKTKCETIDPFDNDLKIFFFLLFFLALIRLVRRNV